MMFGAPAQAGTALAATALDEGRGRVPWAGTDSDAPESSRHLTC